MKCAECRFFYREEGIDRKDCGYCRRNSPSPAYLDGWPKLFARFPWLHEEQWCGDYQSKQ